MANGETVKGGITNGQIIGLLVIAILLIVFWDRIKAFFMGATRPVRRICTLSDGSAGMLMADGSCVPMDFALCTLTDETEGEYHSGVCTIKDNTPCVLADGTTAGKYKSGVCVATGLPDPSAEERGANPPTVCIPHYGRRFCQRVIQFRGLNYVFSFRTRTNCCYTRA